MRNSPHRRHGRGRGRTTSQRDQQSPDKTGRRDDLPPMTMSLSRRNEEEAEVWKTWTSFCLELARLPPNTTIVDVFAWLSHEGEIRQVDIFSRSNGDQLPSAKVHFSQTPVHNFGSEKRRVYNIKHEGQCWTISIDKFYGWNENKMIKNQYPQQITLHPYSLTFGVRLGDLRMKEMKTFGPPPGRRHFGLQLQHGKLTATFPVPSSASGTAFREFKFIVPVAQMKAVYYQECANKPASLVIPLSIPPEYYYKNMNLASTIPADGRSWRVQDSWFRATDLVANFESPQFHPVTINDNLVDDPEFTAIGRWTTMRFRVDARSEAIRHLQLALEDLNVGFIHSQNYEFEPGSSAAIWSLLGHPPTSSSALALLESDSRRIRLRFDVRYQLEVCISRGHLNEHLITEEFLQTLASFDDSVKARSGLEYLVDQDVVLEDPMELFRRAEIKAYHQPSKLPHYCTLVRKAIITPTTIRLSTPVAETSNRVVRHYASLQDHFLRIQFLDEREHGKPGFKVTNEAIYTRMLRTLYQGIRIGDRLYEFLAFGSSQLREGGAYFFCPTQTTSCDDIRKWMGNFNHIKVVAKYAARLGQCFSTTREIRGMPCPQTRMVPDIERNGYCFSDGVGIISKFLSRLIVEEMALDVFDEPTAFQIRMGGCKGVLTVWPQAKGMEVHVRPSQEKFTAQFKALEVIRCSKVATATLNRQTVVILESLKVPVTVFTALLDRHLARFQKSITDKDEAVDLLTQFVDENQNTLVIAELLKANFISGNTKELFVDSILNLWRAWSLKLIKEKARIHVEQSAFVLGVVDETGTLRGHSNETEGSREKDINKLPQIFLQLSNPKVFNKTTIIKGVCIVGRNPSLHPGDIRVVQAVDDPDLRHLKDVVVFPSTGDRPIPSMLSGGDLDGDDFFIIWDQELIPPEWNYPPMSYSGPKPKEVDTVTVDDLREFFVSYQKNDVLGLVASSHLGYADFLKKHGPKDEKCISLAAKHSDAVDFPKTGVPVRWDSTKQMWPHFMEKNPRSTYRSEKALGRIYDKVVQRSLKMEFHTDWEDDFDQRILDCCSANDAMMETVRSIKAQYDTSVRRILSQHSLGTEFELWTSFAMSKPAAGSDYKRSEDLGREYDALKTRFREICYAEAGGYTPEKIDPFVAAMYKVTEEQVKVALREANERTHKHDENRDGVKGSRRLDSTKMPLVTFPWVFPWVMIRLAMGNKYNLRSSLLAPARRNLQLPVFNATQHADKEITHAEAKPSEALNIAAQETAQTNTADDTASVAESAQHDDIRPKKDSGTNANLLDPQIPNSIVVPHRDAEQTPRQVREAEWIDMHGDGASDTQALITHAVHGHLDGDLAAKADPHVKPEHFEKVGNNTGATKAVATGRTSTARGQVIPQAGEDSDGGSADSVLGEEEEIGDMMDKLAAWGA